MTIPSTVGATPVKANINTSNSNDASALIPLQLLEQLQEDPITFISNERFSRRFEVPADSANSTPLSVSYSDFGYRDTADSDSERVLFFCSPLCGSRYLLAAKDRLAKKHRVRIICPDRPGFGETSRVALSDRITTWLRIVPALLEHLNIKHVSALVSHSGGSIYLLNTLLHSRRILHPTKPYVALCAPWVHPTHSGVSLTKFLSSLPAPILNQFPTAAGFMATKMGPMLAFSGGISSGLSSALYRKNMADLPSSNIEDDAAEMARFEAELGPHLVSAIYAGDVSGLAEDAKLLLKRSNDEHIWGKWQDMDTYVPLLAASEAGYRSAPLSSPAVQANGTHANSGEDISPGHTSEIPMSNLQVDVFYAEADHMIGTAAGPAFFDACWAEDERGSHVDYHTQIAKGSDHESIVNIEFGVWEKIFERMP